MKKITPYLILIGICFLVWGKTLNQSFLGEGFFYYDSFQKYMSHGFLASIWEYDNFAKLFFAYLVPLLKDNIPAFQAIQLIIIITLTVVLYKFVKYFTKSPWVAVTSASIFSASYLGLFEMIGVANYERFTQRVPNLIPELLGLLELAKFYNSGKTKHYFYSIILFSISVFMAHYSTFLLPVFILYPIIHSVSKKTSLIKTFKNVIYSVPFALVNIFLISRGVHTPGRNFLAFIEKMGIGNLASRIILQLSNMLIPPFLIKKIASTTSSYENTLIILTLPILIFFIFGIYLVIKRQKKYLLIYLLGIFSLPILLFLNLYLGKVNPLYNMRGYTYYFLPKVYSSDPALTATLKGDRYYVLPYLFLSIIIAILIYVLFKRERVYKYFSIIFLAGYILYNTHLVWLNIDKIQPASEDMKKYLSYIKTVSPEINDQTIIITPKEFIWPNFLIRAVYNHPEIQFLTNNLDWKKIAANTDKKNIILIDFYYDYSQDGKINPAGNRVLPLQP